MVPTTVMAQSLVLPSGPYEDIAAIAAVAAVRSASRDVFFPPKTDTTFSSVSGSGDNSDLIYKAHFAPPETSSTFTLS